MASGVAMTETKVLHLKVLKAIHGLPQSAMLCCKKFKKGMESLGFVVNHCDPCAANKTINGKQMTLCWK